MESKGNSSPVKGNSVNIGVLDFFFIHIHRPEDVFGVFKRENDKGSSERMWSIWVQSKCIPEGGEGQLA